MPALGISTSANSLVWILRWEHDGIDRIHTHIWKKPDIKLIKNTIFFFLGEPVHFFLLVMLFVVHTQPCTPQTTTIKTYKPHPTRLLLIGLKPESWLNSASKFKCLIFFPFTLCYNTIQNFDNFGKLDNNIIKMTAYSGTISKAILLSVNCRKNQPSFGFYTSAKYCYIYIWIPNLQNDGSSSIFLC